MHRNVFAYTASGAGFPDYVSLNEKSGKYMLTVRGPGNQAAIPSTPLTLEIEVPASALKEIHHSLLREFMVTDKA